jgi:hypothetical protein
MRGFGRQSSRYGLFGVGLLSSICSTCLARSSHCRATASKEAFASWSFACVAMRSHTSALSRYRWTRRLMRPIFAPQTLQARPHYHQYVKPHDSSQRPSPFVAVNSYKCERNLGHNEPRSRQGIPTARMEFTHSIDLFWPNTKDPIVGSQIVQG